LKSWGGRNRSREAESVGKGRRSRISSGVERVGKDDEDFLRDPELPPFTFPLLGGGFPTWSLSRRGWREENRRVARLHACQAVRQSDVERGTYRKLHLLFRHAALFFSLSWSGLGFSSAACPCVLHGFLYVFRLLPVLPPLLLAACIHPWSFCNVQAIASCLCEGAWVFGDECDEEE